MSNSLKYKITHNDASCHQIVVNLDASDNIHIDKDFTAPDWAKLDHHQCSHCTLESSQHPYCPIARNLAFLFAGASFGDSFEEVRLEVETGQRQYSAKTTIQRALSSLFGLICSLSPCPYTIPLKPMGLFHLPLANDSETLVRAASFFLLKRYLEHLRDPALPVNLDNMEDTYSNLKELNKCFVKRFREIDESDATVNALILLDVLAKDVDYELEEQLGLLNRFFGLPETNDGFIVS
ncbi:MAG: hypothetical protein KDI30_05515 [Pseudomonadales bacterium]|nr:hypothetical protein [Pseudomonadales bacterium]